MGCGSSAAPNAPAVEAPAVHEGMRVYAKYTNYRDQENGGPWFGATVRSVDGTSVCLLYDDGDEAGEGKSAPAPRLDELRFGESVPHRYKDAELPANALPVCWPSAEAAAAEAAAAEEKRQEAAAAEKKVQEEAAAEKARQEAEAAAATKAVREGMRVYAKYTGYRDEQNGGPWFGATVMSVDGASVELLYDDGDEAGDGKSAPSARLEELRFGRKPVPDRYKNAKLPADASKVPGGRSKEEEGRRAAQARRQEEAAAAKLLEEARASAAEACAREYDDYYSDADYMTSGDEASIDEPEPCRPEPYVFNRTEFRQGVQEGLIYGCTNPTSLALVEDALANGADANARLEGFLPLQQLCHFWDRGDAGPEILDALLGARADINSHDSGGRTPLYTAINYKHLELAATLVKDYAADVKACEKREMKSPLMVACSLMFIDVMPTVKLLLESRANTRQTDCDGYDAIVYASTNDELSNFLREYRDTMETDFP